MEEVQAGSKHSVSVKLRPVDDELLMTVHLTSAVSRDTPLYTVPASRPPHSVAPFLQTDCSKHSFKRNSH